MTILFTANEIRKAIAKMKPNKSSGCDEIPVELIKYAPDYMNKSPKYITTWQKLETYKINITNGILKPLQKPNKEEGPPSNLRPIILLSSLRKIFTTCITSRIKDRLEAEIPPTQAAYRPNRSTNEHVFTSKLIIERTITARNESADPFMLDMSKAFDSFK